MEEQIDKTTLLNQIHSGYDSLTALLSALDEAQMTTPNVNDTWSIKDNIAHISYWHRRLLNVLQAAKDGVEPPDPDGDMTVDQVNEQAYRQNKNRSLADVQNEFHATYQQVLNAVQSISDEELNRPLSWLDGRSICPYIAGNTYGHYEEHCKIIQDWLDR